ncbi:site-specific integrase [Pseudoalteromonas shioyasakiensis]|uniref:site-specific integrase n=1 Tax=Pseudoalteromonas shioyasakiensis TaxID=1190813 RepID=UPI0021177D12|nr:site-specific integrase [Pseudoalteromonas shioyasakiensis]MCQ8876537.1 site-specific integrase [Pseudoalteromonas shioyasakiensis]
MAKGKIDSYLIDLKQRKTLHPCFEEIRTAYLKYSGDFDESYTEEGLTDLYNKICELLYQHFKGCKNDYSKHQFRKIEKKLKSDLPTRQLQLKVIDAIFNYGEEHFKIKALPVTSIVELKKEKPIIVPTSIIKLPIALDLYEILQQELKNPKKDLVDNAEFGRLILLLYFTTDIRSLYELQAIINNPSNLFYAKGISFWSGEIKGEVERYLLCDAAILLLFKLQKKMKTRSIICFKKEKLTKYLQSFLNCYEDREEKWSGLTLAKLQRLRELIYVIYLSPFSYLTYFQPNLSVKLPEACFFRIITGKAIPPEELLEPDLKENNFSDRRLILNGAMKYSAPNEIIGELETIYVALKKRDIQKVPRNEIVKYMHNVLEQSKCQNVYKLLLLTWMYHLLKNGGVHKKKLRLRTVIDYVKSISHPFLTVFTLCNFKELQAPDWETKLNEAAQYFTSGQRRKYLYYFAEYLKESRAVQQLNTDNLDISSTKTEVSANIISASHTTAILEYIQQRYSDLRDNSDQLVGYEYQYAYLLLCLCFYSGLRRSEAGKLYISDLDFSPALPKSDEFDWCTLSIRPNKLRALKSASARRDLPLDGLWPKKHLKVLRSYYQEQDTNHHKNTLLFNCQNSVERAFDLITRLMQYYCKDHSLKVHHLRHSFANWAWCKLNTELLEKMRLRFDCVDDELFCNELNERLYHRLKLKNNTRSKMYILSHLLGHKSVTTTSSSYLHLRDIWLYTEINSQYTVSNKLLNVCVGRAKLTSQKQCLSLIERITFFTLQQESSCCIRLWNKHFTSYIEQFPNLHSFEDRFHPIKLKKLLDYAKILAACNSKSPSEISQLYGLSVGYITMLYENAKAVHRSYPEFGDKLPAVPHFPSFKGIGLNDESKGKTSQEAFKYLCNKADSLLQTGYINLREVYDAVKILKYAAAGKNFAIRSPDVTMNKDFLRLCRMLELKDRHLHFKFHRGELSSTDALEAKQKWETLIKDVGFYNSLVNEAPESEGRFLRNSSGLGYLEISVLISKRMCFRRVQRHYSLFSFFHLLLILSFQSD